MKLYAIFIAAMLLPEMAMAQSGAARLWSLDWSDYDRRLSPDLDGSAFTGARGYWGPGYGLPDHIMLPFNNEKGGDDSTVWPMALPSGRHTPEYEAVWKDAGRQIRAHLDQDPRWRKVTRIKPF
jgi:hypothetical protein